MLSKVLSLKFYLKNKELVDIKTNKIIKIID